jgi:hypothetical protein
MGASEIFPSDRVPDVYQSDRNFLHVRHGTRQFGNLDDVLIVHPVESIF